MNRSALPWVLLLVLGGGFLLTRAVTSEMGKVYVRQVEVAPEGFDQTWIRYDTAEPRFRNEPDVELSWARTFGVWIAAYLTLSIFSFLYGDNVFYRLAESIFVGVSAAYVMVVGFWTGIVQNLFGKLIPGLIRGTVLPGLRDSQESEWVYIIPLVLSALMLMRLWPAGSWIARWPLAFFIGATAGLRLLGFFEADFVRQIQNTILPLLVFAEDGGFRIGESLKNTTIVLGVFSSLVYFFFSFEHKGIIGGFSKLGIWFLMITFGASFGYTVMGRIALLAQRLEFLFDDWLWIIDPAARRLGM